MNDRTHFFLSCAILVFIVSLALRPQVSALSPRESALDLERKHRPTIQSIHRFLEMEEGVTAVSIRPTQSILKDDKADRLTQARDRQEFIPMNVVPLQGKSNSTPPPAGSSVPARKPQTPQVAQTRDSKLSRAMSRQLMQIESNASDLISQSQDAFSRGLLSLSDYQLALNIGYQSKIDCGEFRGVKDVRVIQLSEKQNLLVRAVKQLQMMNQPAARGWYGDVVHARLILAQNRYDLAAASENKEQQGFALQDINRLTNQYFSIRKEELAVGEVDLNEYRRASQSVFDANRESNAFFKNQDNELANLSEYTRRLEGIQKTVEMMADRGAGRGRQDLVELSQAQLAYFQGNYYRQANDDRRSSQLFGQSSQHAKAAWEVRINTYYPAGTASLHELTTAWIMWKSADAESQKLQTAVSVESDPQLATGLDRMINLTGQIQDRRGRMASDVSLIYCLKDADQLAEIKKETE